MDGRRWEWAEWDESEVEEEEEEGQSQKRYMVSGSLCPLVNLMIAIQLVL